MLSGQKQTIKKPNGSYFLTLTVVGWVDIFTREKYQKIIIETFQYYIKHRGLNIYSFCVMSNHIHLTANTNGTNSLSDVIRDVKKYSSRQIILAIQNETESRRECLLDYFSKCADSHAKSKNFKVWQDGNHAIELFNERFTWTKVQYIHQNPVRAGIISSSEYWKYSSAGHYQEMESVLPEVFRLIAPVNFK